MKYGTGIGLANHKLAFRVQNDMVNTLTFANSPTWSGTFHDAAAVNIAGRTVRSIIVQEVIGRDIDALEAKLSMNAVAVQVHGLSLLC